ncbi:MAG: hypothetical protein WAW88_04700 [Nocardioides sp.]
MADLSPPPHIIDAGPALNFLATKNQRILIAAIGGQRFAAPQAVRDEVFRKGDEDPRFAPAVREWKKIEARFIHLLPATRTPERDKIARILTRNPLPQVPSLAKDLGETYVVVHATEMAMSGAHVFVIIDDRGGKILTARAQQFLGAQRRLGAVGTIRLIDTETILRSQINTPRIPNKPFMRRIYGQLQTVTSGLEHISTTDLLTHDLWKQPRRP